MVFLQIARKTKKTLEICKIVRKEGGKIKVGPFKKRGSSMVGAQCGFLSCSIF
jgi:hypothetical protein